MGELLSVAELTKLAGFFAPGFIILGIRVRFKGGRLPSLSEGAILYALFSSAYYAAISPFFHVEGGLSLPAWISALLQFCIVPFGMGAALVYVDQKEWFYHFCRWAKIRVEHHTSTAWDFAFSRNRDPSYVIVRLNDGTKYFSAWTSESFASSLPGERDLYLDRVFEVRKDGKWQELEPRRSVVICSKDISWIELIGSRGDE